MTERQDLLLLKATQGGLPLTRRPYARVGQNLGLSEMDVIQGLRRLGKQGLIRRVAASVDHRRLGIIHNVMIAWKIPQERLVEAGEAASALDAVSHVYEREPAAGWPYNLYTVVHARTEAGCRAIIERLTKALRPDEKVELYSERELKKTPLNS